MATNETLMRQTIALHSAASTVVAQAEAILSALEETMAAAPLAAPAPAGDSDPSKCAHPAKDRLDTTCAGGARSFFCPHCKHTSDELGIEGQG